MRSGDIRGHSLKFSYIAANFGRFLPSKIITGQCPPKSCMLIITETHYHTPWRWVILSFHSVLTELLYSLSVVPVELGYGRS